MSRDLSKYGSRTRTEDLRREIEAASRSWRQPWKSRAAWQSALIWTGFVLAMGLLLLWTRHQPLVDAGRVVRETRTVQSEFRVPDEAATTQERAAARLRTPRVYVASQPAIEEIRNALAGLPEALRGATTIEQVEPSLQKQFALTRDGLAGIRQYLEPQGVSKAWTERVQRLIDEVVLRTPLLDPQTFQVEQTSTASQIELRIGEPGGPGVFINKTLAESVGTGGGPNAGGGGPGSSGGSAAGAGGPGGVGASTSTAAAPIPGTTGSVGGSGGNRGNSVPVNIASPIFGEEMKRWGERAGFSGAVMDAISSRLAQAPKPTFAFDKDLSIARQNEEEEKIKPRSLVYAAGEVIFKRGDVLSATQLSVYRRALEAERDQAAPLQAWTSRAGVFGLVAAIALALAGYTLLFVPRVRRNPMRVAAIAALLTLTAVLACYSSATQPGLIAMLAVAPTMFVAVMLCVAYDQRVALAYGSLHGVLVAAALQQPVAVYAVMVAGVGIAVWRLKEVRDRDALIKMGLWGGATLAGGTFVASLLSLPATPIALKQAAWDAGLAGLGGLLVAGVTLFILPVLEKLFDITTGMTLVELRDPKQPLLRQLQQRAPGTYNHSLNLASLAEASAEAISANGLLAYVGALYHDIGKMNKPDYFVENQPPGFNKHDKLSPAMSLLVIVGHVKDGMELAREFNLPRPLWHFIESHHGTTLVEYFFQRARRKAEQASKAGEDIESPSELEYRYPGPKPRTKEAAIIMLCDAVESAARSMTDPTPSRLDATVRAIANRRLMDGQFDECDLTLRELNTIVETVSKTLASIYHGRIAYPSMASPGQTRELEPPSMIATPSVVATPSAGAASIAGGSGAGNGGTSTGRGLSALTSPVAGGPKIREASGS
jgi:cyclic-di-AMP phosphodiesterase PgpH